MQLNKVSLFSADLNEINCAVFIKKRKKKKKEENHEARLPHAL